MFTVAHVRRPHITLSTSYEVKNVVIMGEEHDGFWYNWLVRNIIQALLHKNAIVMAPRLGSGISKVDSFLMGVERERTKYILYCPWGEQIWRIQMRPNQHTILLLPWVYCFIVKNLCAKTIHIITYHLAYVLGLLLYSEKNSMQKHCTYLCVQKTPCKNNSHKNIPSCLCVGLTAL